jgi:hypothetical protein
MEARVAVLEQIAKDMKDLLRELKDGVLRQETRQHTDFLWLLGVMLGGFAGLFGFMAHGFHWL